MHRSDELHHPGRSRRATGDWNARRADVIDRPRRPASGADRLAFVTATNSGFPVPERDDAAQPGLQNPRPPSRTATPETKAPAESSVTMSKPPLGAPIDRIPVHKVSPVIEGGAYPAKAVVGESIPIRATVFREGHDAVNASVVLTDPNGNERLEPMHPTTPVGFDWWTASVVLDTEGHGRSESKAGAILGDLGAQRRDQDPRRNRCFPHVHRRHCAV